MVGSCEERCLKPGLRLRRILRHCRIRKSSLSLSLLSAVFFFTFYHQGWDKYGGRVQKNKIIFHHPAPRESWSPPTPDMWGINPLKGGSGAFLVARLRPSVRMIPCAIATALPRGEARTKESGHWSRRRRRSLHCHWCASPLRALLCWLTVAIMRWGFRRSFNAAINNARCDKLEAGIWAEAFHARRCVIPMSSFFERGPGPGGRKQAHEFRDPEGDFLWIAGIWENGEGEIGPCYSMVTTAASPLMAPIHNRMPAVLGPEERLGFLAGSSPWDFQPYAGPLVVEPCESPLAKPRPKESP
jgi:hypothetical protein